MRLHKARREYGCHINIAPLIDVVFLLIVFFLMVSHMAQVRVDALSLPEAREGKTEETLNESRVTINIHSATQMVINGRDHTLSSLEILLDQMLQHRNPQTLSILIRSDREAHWHVVSDVMKLCSRKGINLVNVAVIEPNSGI